MLYAIHNLVLDYDDSKAAIKFVSRHGRSPSA